MALEFTHQSASESRRRFFLTSIPKLSRRGLRAASALSVPCRNSAAAPAAGGFQFLFRRGNHFATPSSFSNGFSRALSRWSRVAGNASSISRVRRAAGPFAFMIRNICSAATRPSPVVPKSRKIRCPLCSPPKLKPFLSNSSITFLSPTAVRIIFPPAILSRSPDRRCSSRSPPRFFRPKFFARACRARRWP